ncbi:MAG: dihydrolipoyl dehydrogenase [bacterium]|nr:dihydrolipoyl dehydrogenase [bacterium]
MDHLSEVRVPDLGTDDSVDVVEVLVAAGDQIALEDSLITLESDKASMDVPSPVAGKVRELKVKRGDTITQGSLILLMEVTEEAASEFLEMPSESAGSATRDESSAHFSAEPSAAERIDPAASVSPASATAAETYDTDLVVIGAGVGGYTAAFRAADLGLRVTLIERYPVLGGVCLNVGCIPSKALLHVAEVVHEAGALAEHGVSFGPPEVDLDRLRSWKTEVVGRLTGGLRALAKRRNVRVVEGTAQFAGPHEIEIDGSDELQKLSFAQATIAAGSRVVKIPGVPYDDPRVMDSTDALELAETPESLLLVGGGIIGLEMAMVYGALGTKLTVVELLDGLIPGCDRDLVKPLEKRLRKDLDAEIHLGTKVAAIESSEAGLIATLVGPDSSKSSTFDRALIAVGRRPNGDLLNAGAAGVAVDERGFIAVDRSQRTNQPHIYAIGDIVGEPMLAHKAAHQAKVAAENAAGEKSAFDARAIPSVAYTDPEIAWVGLSELEARETGTSYEKAVFPWSASGRSLGMGRTDGRTKLLFDPETKRLLGAGIVGPGAGDLISEIALAIEMDCEATDLALTIHPHPTVSETIGFAAEAFEGTITDLYLPKRR